MNRFLLTITAISLSFSVQAQCPDLFQAMVNSCGTTEGNNEFVVFTTAVAANASTYKFNYGSTNPPTVNNMAGSDAGAKTGAGSVTTTSGCAVVEVTSPGTLIPANTRVIFIPVNLDQPYDVTGLCDGANPIYVVYIKTNSQGGSNSNWSNGGTMSNSATTPRYLQVTYSGSASCNGTNAPVKNYIASGNWPFLSGTSADGNFVTWRDTTAGYYNNGCTTIVVPVQLESFTGKRSVSENLLSWNTSQEFNTAYFVIERSVNGAQFAAVGTVTAAGESQTVTHYSFKDAVSGGGNWYYRLKLVDRDGKIHYSSILRLNAGSSSGSIAVYPNPVQHEAALMIQSGSKAPASWTIYSALGAQVQSGTRVLMPGTNRIGLNVQNLPAGIYRIQIITESGRFTTSFLKQAQ